MSENEDGSDRWDHPRNAGDGGVNARRGAGVSCPIGVPGERIESKHEGPRSFFLGPSLPTGYVGGRRWYRTTDPLLVSYGPGLSFIPVCSRITCPVRYLAQLYYSLLQAIWGCFGGSYSPLFTQNDRSIPSNQLKNTRIELLRSRREVSNGFSRIP